MNGGDGTEGLLWLKGPVGKRIRQTLKASVPVSVELSLEKGSVTGTVQHPAVPGSQPLSDAADRRGQAKGVTSSHRCWTGSGRKHAEADSRASIG